MTKKKIYSCILLDKIKNTIIIIIVAGYNFLVIYVY